MNRKVQLGAVKTLSMFVLEGWTDKEIQNLTNFLKEVVESGNGIGKKWSELTEEEKESYIRRLLKL